MWREKKTENTLKQTPTTSWLPPEKPIEVVPVAEPTKSPVASTAELSRSQLGRSMVLKGDLSGNEDLVISGKFDGSINMQGHCVTIGLEGRVKADIQAARVIVHGFVDGNITVRERVEIFKTGHVAGDLIAPGISIEDGAFYKGKIEILREEADEPERPVLAPGPKQSSPMPPHVAN
jgi:cytoskeletal protein CcmA (bactofilin family)